MRTVLPFTFILFALTFLASCQKHSPDLVLLNGRIWTAEDKQTFVEAVAVNGNLITQTGTTEVIRGLVGSSTKVIDLQGKLVIPGFPWWLARTFRSGSDRRNERSRDRVGCRTLCKGAS
jgi:hypothetical protein